MAATSVVAGGLFYTSVSCRRSACWSMDKVVSDVLLGARVYLTSASLAAQRKRASNKTPNYVTLNLST
jgi:hypothetical protein